MFYVLSLALLDIGLSFSDVTFCPKQLQYSSAESNYSDVLTSCMLIHICISSPLEIDLVHSPVFDNYHISLKPLSCHM
jgi:hypothetical protein